jgi:hypothetical protein
MPYNYTITLRPYGHDRDAGIVQIDPDARYGYWEYRNGSEGGGLWFQPANPDTAAGPLELVDYDGSYYLPAPVVIALREAGIVIDSEDFPESCARA